VLSLSSGQLSLGEVSTAHERFGLPTSSLTTK